MQNFSFVLKFTPLEFETYRADRNIFESMNVKIYSVGV